MGEFDINLSIMLVKHSSWNRTIRLVHFNGSIRDIGGVLNKVY